MKKLLTIALAAILACSIFAFAGCGDPLDNYDDYDTIIIATNSGFPPFEFIDGNELKGIDVELAYAIGEILGKQIKFEDMEFESVVTAVANGTAHMAMAGLTITPLRQQSVAFSTTYYKASQYLLIKKGDTTFSQCQSADDVVEKINELGSAAKFGFQNGTTGEFYARGDEDWGFDGFENAQFTGYTNAATAVSSLISGAINIVIVDELPAKALQKANENDIELVPYALTDEEYAIAVNKHQKTLLKKVNEALQQLKDNGKFDEIVQKYFENFEFETEE